MPFGAQSAGNLLPSYVQGAHYGGIGLSGVAATPGVLTPQLELLYRHQQLQQQLVQQYELSVMHQQLQLQPRQLQSDFSRQARVPTSRAQPQPRLVRPRGLQPLATERQHLSPRPDHGERDEKRRRRG
ncbi:hypothetical protein CYMTET_39504 [Cymbomonas tetramitiformis]|uniref:Uncharacterized protein n=1 Tax=Cymbomonas tetramitiformis TaxID=36881 RepID=A0AAE0F4L1_9CHLO|nr:hypothetical protein CYMTET_39504 [Cymbomonas tetramitiformis]